MAKDQNPWDAYILHMPDDTSRDGFVAEIQAATGAAVFPAIRNAKDPVKGCLDSHVAIYKKADPTLPVLIFEDDIQILDPSIFTKLKSLSKQYDVIYLGNSKLFKNIYGQICSYGTFAMWISPAARRAFLNYLPLAMAKGVDNIWCELEHGLELRVWRSPEPTRYIKVRSGVYSNIKKRVRNEL